MGMAEQVDEGAIVAWPKPRSTDLRTEAGCNCHGIGHTTLQDALFDKWVAQTHDRFPEHWHPGKIKGQPSPAIRSRNAHAMSIIVGINRDDAFDPRVMVRGNNQWDHATDRNADKGDVFEIELVEEPFNGFDEQLGTIVGLGNVRKAVPRIVEGVDRERIRKERYELFKYIELS